MKHDCKYQISSPSIDLAEYIEALAAATLAVEPEPQPELKEPEVVDSVCTTIPPDVQSWDGAETAVRVYIQRTGIQLADWTADDWMAAIGDTPVARMFQKHLLRALGNPFSDITIHQDRFCPICTPSRYGITGDWHQ